MSEFNKEFIDDVRQMQEEMDQLLNQLVNWRKAPAANRLWRPYADVWECDNEVVVVIELAGVKPADVTLALTNCVLIVRGERHPQPVTEGSCFRNVEMSVGRFERLIHLPETIDADRVHAVYKDGLLEIRIGKSSIVRKAAREISITGE